MKISILLPYKENFSANYAGAVSLFVKDTIINSKEINTVLLEVPWEPVTISEDMRYANFELEVPEITEEIYDNASINAYIKRTYEDDTPDRWS